MTDNQFKIALRAAALSFALAPAATAVALGDSPGYLFQDINPQPSMHPALSAVSRGNHSKETAAGASSSGHVAPQSNAASSIETNAGS